MPYNRTFDFTGLPGFYKNNLDRDNSSVVDDFFNTLNAEQNTGLDPRNHWYTDNSASDIWHFHPSECGDLSQLRAGLEAFGNLNGPPGLYGATIAPTSLYPGSLVFLDEGHGPSLYPGVGMRTSQQPATVPFFTNCAPSPIPTLSCSSWSPSSGPYSAPTTAIRNPIDLPHTAPYPEELGLSCLPAEGPTHLSSSYIMSEEGHAILLEIPFPDPVASPSGAQRTGGRAKQTTRYNPVRSTKKRYDPGEGKCGDGWDVILVRFRAKIREIVRSGQLPKGLAPEKALVAKIVKSVREELKRSPLQNTKGREGKRPRNVEDYLTGILREIVIVKPTPIQSQSESEETDTKMVVFARIADVLEARLVAVNQHLALRRLSNESQPGVVGRLEQTVGRVKKNQRERIKRDMERYHLERISYLFKAADPQRTWTRVDVLSFAAIFLLYGPGAFSPGFVEAAYDQRRL